MPISDFVRNFLQNVQYAGTGIGWTPEQQAEMRARSERQAAGQQAQENWQKQFAAQQDARQQAQEEAQGRLFAELLKNPDIQMAPNARTEAEPSLTGAGPSLGGGGGVQGAVQATPQPFPTLPQMLAEQAAGGQQQQPGFGVNAPGALPSGITTPSDRVPTANGASGGGGVVQPARTSIPLNLPGLGSKFPNLQYTSPGAPAGKEEKPVPDALADKFGLPHGITLPPQQLAELAVKSASIEKPKEPSKEEGQQQTAAQMVAQAEGLKGSFKHITDLPLEHQAKAWDQLTQLNASEADKEIKAARLQKQQADTEKYADQKAADGEVVKELQENPQVWFNKSIPDAQRARVRIAASAAGIRIPTAEPTQKMKDKLEAADEIQRQVNIMRNIAQELGPANFGAVIGRMTNAEGAWGTPILTKDPRTATLEQEFRNHSRLLTMQEVQAFGGGRTAVQLYQAVKGVTPQPTQSFPILEGAFNGTMRRAQQTKDAIKAYMYGDALKTPSPYKEGQTVMYKGKPVKITNLQPNGDFDPVPVNK